MFGVPVNSDKGTQVNLSFARGRTAQNQWAGTSSSMRAG